MEAVHHLQVHSEIFLGEVVQHPRINETLHEVAAVLWETQAGQPLIANPLVVHVPIGQCLQGSKWRSSIFSLFFSLEKPGLGGAADSRRQVTIQCCSPGVTVLRTKPRSEELNPPLC